jgi:hypothetical protein
MFSRWPKIGALTLTTVVASLGIGVALTQPPPGPEGGRPPGPPRGHGEKMGETYDRISLLSLCLGTERAKLTREDVRLFEPVKELYRSAIKARQDGDGRRADEMALAANDAARGLVYALSASNPGPEALPLPPESPPPPLERGRDDPPPPKGKAPPPPKGKDAPPPPPPGKEGDEPPPPPPGAGRDAPPSPEESARMAVRRLRDRPDDRRDVDTSRELSRPFVEASKRAADAAQGAFHDKDYRKAIEWARAAEAWSNVSEHLARAQEPDRERPRERAPAPPDGRRTPPPRD